jgi:hypothetical protein
LTQVSRRLDAIEERRLAGSGHDNASHSVYVAVPNGLGMIWPRIGCL